MGGSDVANQGEAILKKIENVPGIVEVHFLTSTLNPNLPKMKLMNWPMQVHFHSDLQATQVLELIDQPFILEQQVPFQSAEIRDVLRRNFASDAPVRTVPPIGIFSWSQPPIGDER